MTRIEALKELAENVEAGRCVMPDDVHECGAIAYHHESMVVNAYNGSLDAAKALHDAVLPGWDYNVAPEYCHVIPPHDGGDDDASTGCAGIPARAWLLAIIGALIAEEATA